MVAKTTAGPPTAARRSRSHHGDLTHGDADRRLHERSSGIGEPPSNRRWPTVRRPCCCSLRQRRRDSLGLRFRSRRRSANSTATLPPNPVIISLPAPRRKPRGAAGYPIARTRQRPSRDGDVDDGVYTDAEILWAVRVRPCPRRSCGRRSSPRASSPSRRLLAGSMKENFDQQQAYTVLALGEPARAGRHGPDRAACRGRGLPADQGADDDVGLAAHRREVPDDAARHAAEQLLRKGARRKHVRAHRYRAPYRARCARPEHRLAAAGRLHAARWRHDEGAAYAAACLRCRLPTPPPILSPSRRRRRLMAANLTDQDPATKVLTHPTPAGGGAELVVAQIDLGPPATIAAVDLIDYGVASGFATTAPLSFIQPDAAAWSDFGAPCRSVDDGYPRRASRWRWLVRHRPLLAVRGVRRRRIGASRSACCTCGTERADFRGQASFVCPPTPTRWRLPTATSTCSGRRGRRRSPSSTGFEQVRGDASAVRQPLPSGTTSGAAVDHPAPGDDTSWDFRPVTWSNIPNQPATTSSQGNRDRSSASP